MKKIYIYILILAILTSLLSIDLFLHKGIFTAHDIEANIGRFGAFALSLKEGRLTPGWAGYVANGYGSPILIFTYLTSYYFQLPIHLLGFSLVDTVKIYIFISWILSSIFMFFFLKKHFSDISAFFGSLFYVFAPYRINDIFARGSISEHTAFMMIPLVAISLYNLSKSRRYKNILFVIASVIGLVMSHPFIFIVSLPFYILYFFHLYLDTAKSQKFNFVKSTMISLSLSILISSFFILPIIFENKYLHYDINPFLNVWSTQFVPFIKLLKPQWTFIDVTGKMEYQTYQIGIIQIITALFAIPIYFWSSVKHKRIISLSFVLFILSVFFMSSISAICYKVFKVLQQIQFPWRFSALTVLAVSILAAGNIEVIAGKVKNSYIKIGIYLMIGLSLIILNLPYSKGHGYKIIDDNYYLYQLVNNSEGIATTPLWASASESYKRASFLPETYPSGAKIDYIYRSNFRHIYNIEASSSATVIDNTFYFPNWTVYANGKQVPIEFQNPEYRGLITFQIPEGKNTIEVIFKDTKLRIIANGISITFLLLIVVYSIFKLNKIYRRKIFV